MPSTTGDTPPTVVIGIDFGTTYSGVAWSRSGKKGQIKLVTDWKTLKNYQSDKEKVPSAIFYRHMNDEDPAWGFATPLEETVLRWFKLLLVDEQYLSEKVRRSPQLVNARSLMQRANKTAVQVFGDYLSKVWDHSRDDITKAVGNRMLKISRVHVVVTLPAIWPHYVRGRMTEALKRAGLLGISRDGETTLSFISEPEAAALTCLEENSDRPDVNVGDHFMVCDVGGGTVDIITYKVEKLNPLIVSESVEGDGDLCGAMFLDEKFLALFKERIGSEALKKLQPGALQKIMDDEWGGGIKSSICKASGGWDIQLHYNGPVNSRLCPSKVTIDGDAIRNKVYKPVIEQIQQLVSKQINQVKKKHRRMPKFTILVGGFGKSRYLYECLRDTVGNRMEILQENGAGPWTAVVRGAVLHGMARSGLTESISVAVDSRVSRHSYGTLVNILPFDPKEHDAKDRVYCEGHQEFLAVEQTQWFVEIGESVSTYDPIVSNFWQDLTKPDEYIQVEIVISDSTTAPTRKDDSVKLLCEIKASELPKWDELPVWTNKDGKVFRRITYELRIVSDGSSLEFAVYYKDKRLASESVMFDSTSRNAESDDEEDSPKMKPRQLMTELYSSIIRIDSDSDYVDD
ncbi:hypothetical protein FSARC_9617 [Fusarium sarcochroum]|uniref:Uncharacterized protein n=1 Tax=Fusarium sarcochroum TaxID=1208366 RepID=A0A8H4X5Z5_9HYPO|nr:hypothetical protein FSARC_9617 [Fusarium sarcochroum]